MWRLSVTVVKMQGNEKLKYVSAEGGISQDRAITDVQVDEMRK